MGLVNFNLKKMILIDGPISPGLIAEVIEKAVNNAETGGHSIFIGEVRRDNISGRSVRAIEYSAYEEMVMGETDKIRKLILSEFDDVKAIRILHSKGVVNAGEISLLVAVSAGHRQQAMTACAKAVELVKERLPVWKKEIFDDNTDQWKQND